MNTLIISRQSTVNFWASVQNPLKKKMKTFFRDTTTCYADQDDDIIFEDFARLRLKGETEA
jgi:hypothetical protein